MGTFLGPKPGEMAVTEKIDRSADPFKRMANADKRSLAELTHIARCGINARGGQTRVKEGGPPLEHGLEDEPVRIYPYPPSWA